MRFLQQFFDKTLSSSSGKEEYWMIATNPVLSRIMGLEGVNQRMNWYHSDMAWMDVQASWSVFTMYWPSLAIYALVGRE